MGICGDRRETTDADHVLYRKSDFDQAMNEKGTLMVLDCFATWCGPCKVIAPQVVKYVPHPFSLITLMREQRALTNELLRCRFSNEFPDARFYKIDVDEVPDVAQELGIRAMPTFLMFRDGDKVDEVVGANPQALKAAIEKQLKSGEAKA